MQRDVYEDIQRIYIYIYIWDEISCFDTRMYERNKMAQYKQVNEYVGKCFEMQDYINK